MVHKGRFAFFVVLALIATALLLPNQNPQKASAISAKPASASTTAAWRDSLSVGSVYWTGKYKSFTRDGLSYFKKVYFRSAHACFAENSGFTQSCMNVRMVYAEGYAVCVTTCTIAGQRGYQYCMVAGSDSIGFSSELNNCYNQRIKYNTAAKAVEEDKLCNPPPLFYCTIDDWHLNLYYTGSMTGPYGGKGIEY